MVDFTNKGNYTPGVTATGETFGEKTVQFLTHGLSSAAYSAGISFANTGIALNNMFGGDATPYDVNTVIRRNLGVQESEYYQENQGAIDAVGFIGGSLIPGLGAIKALQVAQKSISTTARLSTGIRAALVPQNGVVKIANTIKNEGVTAAATALRVNRNRYIASGFHQQALEAAAFEGAVLLTMNQSPTITGEDMTYMEGITSNLGGAGFGLLFGTAIGGTLQAVADLGAAKILVRNAEVKDRAISRVLSEGEENNIIIGDAAIAPMTTYLEAKAFKAEGKYNTLEPGQQKEFDAKLRKSREDLELTLTRMTDANEDMRIQIFNLLDKATSQEEVNFLLAGIKKFDTFKQDDLLYDIPTSTVEFMFKDEAAKFYAGIKTDVEGGSFTDNLLAGKLYVRNNLGFAFPHPGIGAAVRNQQGIRGVSIIENQKDWDDIFTFRHETGHTWLYESAESLAQLSPLGKKLRDQAEVLSRIARPQHWANVDAIYKYMDDVNVPTKQMIKDIQYMNNTHELFADAYAIISDPVKRLQFDLTKDFPDLMKLLIANKSLAQKFSGGKGVLELNSGKLLDDAVTPTAADLSATRMFLKDNYVEYAGGKRASLTAKFNIDTALAMSWQEASAVYSASKVRKDIIPGMEVHRHDIPRLTAAKAQGIAVKIMDDTAGDVTSSFASIDDALLAAKYEVGAKLVEQSRLKQQANRDASINPLSTMVDAGEDALTDAQIGRLIDTGPLFPQRISALSRLHDPVAGTTDGVIDAVRDIPFWSARDDIDPMKPYYAVVRPDRRAVVKGKVQQGIAETQMRIANERASYEPMIASYLGDAFHALPDSTYATGENFGENVSAVDATSSFVASANSQYLTGAERAQYIGKIVDRVMQDKVANVSRALDSQIVRLAADQDAIYEASVLDTILRQSTGGNEFEFIPKDLKEYIAELADAGKAVDSDKVEAMLEAGVFDAVFTSDANRIWGGEFRKLLTNFLTDNRIGMEEADNIAESLLDMSKNSVHVIRNEGLGQFWRTLVDYNGKEVVAHKNRLSAMLGGRASYNPRALYPGPVDTTKYPNHALVVFKKKGLMGKQQVGMVVAKDADTLQQRVAQVKAQWGDNAEIHTDSNIQRYKEIRDEYNSQLLFQDTFMDTSVRRRGIAWDVSPEPNPEIFNQYKAVLERQHSGLTRSFVEVKYSEELAALRNQAESIEAYNSIFSKASKGRNAYRDVENMMLNKRPEDRDNLWSKMNTITEKHVSEALFKVMSIVKGGQKSGDWELMNKKLEEYGLPEIYSPMIPLVLHNANAPTPVLSKLTAKFNAAVGTMMLRMDGAHAIVNAVSMPIMASSELSNLRKAITSDRWVALKNATSIKIPGTELKSSTLAPLMMQATANFAKSNDTKLLELYKSRGIINSTLEEFKLAQLTVARIAGEVDAEAIDTVLDKAINVMSKPSDFSEQMVKFIAANMADMIAQTAKLDENLRWSLINNFVARTHGNYLASQRPTLFQGWGGQAIGLFQTYQFNLIQSLLSNVASGNKAAVAKMVGLQAGIFGAQSLPGFQLLNQYIGERSTEHNDFYKVSAGILGTDESNALMYGLASSATVPIFGDGIDLYSRGDLSPRTPILIPTSPSEIPAISITGKFIATVTNAVSKMENGAPLVPTMLDALSHNAFNRPLQGLGQLMAGERTTANGQLLVSYEAWDNWNALTKLLGTKTLSEAVATSSFYRTAAYSTYRAEELNSLGEAYRQTIRAGAADPEAYMDVMRSYSEKGGNMENFGQWVIRQNAGATQSQIDMLRNQNNSPEGRYLQGVMGGSVEDTFGTAPQ